MTKSIKNLEIVIGVGSSLIASEHFFSTLLSSPWTTQKFSETEEEKALIRRMLFLASSVSLIAAGGISWLTKEKWPIVFTLILCVFYIIIYEKAVNKEL